MRYRPSLVRRTLLPSNTISVSLAVLGGPDTPAPNKNPIVIPDIISDFAAPGRDRWPNASLLLRSVAHQCYPRLSFSRSLFFLSSPHRYPPRCPSSRTTRWHGIAIATAFR